MSQIDRIDHKSVEFTEQFLAKAEELFAFDSGLLDEIRATDLREMAICQKNIQNMIENLKASASAMQKVYDIIRMDIIPTKMDDTGVTNIKFEGVGKIVLTGDINASIKADSKEAAYEWLGDHGHGDLIVPTVNSSSLKALLKKKMQEGEEVPDDLFNVSPFTRASITKG